MFCKYLELKFSKTEPLSQCLWACSLISKFHSNGTFSGKPSLVILLKSAAPFSLVMLYIRFSLQHVSVPDVLRILLIFC